MGLAGDTALRRGLFGREGVAIDDLIGGGQQAIAAEALIGVAHGRVAVPAHETAGSAGVHIVRADRLQVP